MGGLLALYKSVNYDPDTQQFPFAAPKGYSILQFLLINLIGPLIAGVSAGTFIVFVLKERLKTKSYLTFIALMGIVFFIFILVLNTGVSYIFYFNDQLSGSSSLKRDFISNFLMDPYAIRNILTWMIIAFVTVIMLQVSDKYGPGVFSNFILGKYYHPQEEERIFMFLDLNDSTNLAEKLGNIQFFKMLNSYFTDITDSILNNQGEIYQYVGDEIVISWTASKGLNQNHCVQCFFDIEMAIEQKAQTYHQLYGVVPKFKAGIHMGKAIVGEIGIIKKDIVYSGDVLNTAARVRGMCKNYQQKLIITQLLYERLKKEDDIFCYSGLGQIQLRGKEEDLGLWAVSLI